MNEQERWLKERVEEQPAIDPGEKAAIEHLANKSLSEADLSSCISILAILLSLDALIPLIFFMKDNSHSIPLRHQAVKAISTIGSNYVESELKALLSSSSSELRSLAGIALGADLE